ncbi:MAG TPA: metallophosphoesterase, partial [Longimicrobiales bacterium]|nr:metallophosphoesterase [Longimicrobiales bacterium]
MSSTPHNLSRRSFVVGLAGAAALSRADPTRAEQVGPSLALRPFLARPTTASIVVTAQNGPMDVSARLEVRQRGPTTWRQAAPPIDAQAGADLAWEVDGLSVGTAYEYRLLLETGGGEPAEVDSGRFTTQRVGETSFTAALMTDPHTGSFAEGSGPVSVLDDVVRNVRAERPDFVLALGDNVAWATSRELPQPDERGAVSAYSMYRRHIAPLTTACPHFGLIGNWEGESGKVPSESTALMAAVRRRFTPHPDEATYPQGGSENEDYYAFAWGPALFVVLNVQSYTEPSGSLGSLMDDVTLVEDWTLGRDQMTWLERTLATADQPFRFICIHHPVGGNAATHVETLYGRGGPRAARVGEQRIVHELMREHGVQIFFYGHDHVFVDEVV